ncbi:hypothetical protein [Marinobacter sp. AN1]|uniref:RIFT barrel domain-containing protein n=1 Tax=Marinobacter sp. AN1 TaxID=2886046 RepID=UPI00222FF46D|nr:hypothetical protein [Marinobacter sp. AN1]UZD66517.1 hypothetical protein LJ360_03990 [Marinobacter sp. AN1]
MEAISIRLREEQGIRHEGEAFQLGIPLKQGDLSPDAEVILVDTASCDEIICQSSPMASWPDGSVRWLKLQFLGNLGPGAERTLELCSRETPTSSSSLLTCTRDPKGLAVDTGACRFNLTANSPTWVHTETSIATCHQLTLTTEEGKRCQALIDADWEIVEHGPVSLSCQQTGWFLDDDVRLARFHCRLTFYHNSKTIEVQTCLHNPKRARHPGGLWDLGDPGSIHFRSMEIRAELADIEHLRVTPEPGMPAVELDSKHGTLYQDSSGGEHWDSLNHVNAKGEVTTRFRGYRLRIGDHIQMSGNRANPVISVATPLTTVQATLPNFWQNFPSSIGVQDNGLIVGLFPGETAEVYELQGGERKTQTAYFHYSDYPDALAWTLAPTTPVLDAKQYQESQALPWFTADAPRGPLDELIQLGLEGQSNFFAKREVIDEYGWRHFGELFADHESLYLPPDEPPLISHYNNQYDPIYGFARQFAATGDHRWYELMNDLASHVRDIDIYHTNEDRSEYNHGLFWHTDHYLPAHTATHRTFSKYNDTSSTPGQTGGGPAEQHCYTTGLLYHYFLTGCSASREAVLELANWIVTQREGDPSFLGQLELAKRRELPNLKATLRGKNPPDRQYALNRGTGNYLNTLLDAYWLTLESKWMKRAERIIKSTLHPADELAERNLTDTETSWSYLIFLASLARYLDMKRLTRQRDDSFRYALACMESYAGWICANERPFLEQPEKLEFPNDTWVAQDIRKAMLLFQAASFLPARSDEFLRSAEKWLNYVTSHLKDSPECQMTRIQVILLQNTGPNTCPVLVPTSPLVDSGELDMLKEYDFGEQPRLTRRASSTRLLRRLFSGLRKLDLAKEKAWLTSRLAGR